jgi:hypothetical protein
MQIPSQREQWQQIMVRKERDVRTWVSENFDGTEQYSIRRDPSGLAILIGFRSIRAKELLLRLHQDVFSQGFARPTPSLDENGVWTVWFGYVEPLQPPTHYVSMDAY